EVQGLIVIKPGPGGGPMAAGGSSRQFGKMASLHLHLAGATFRDVLEARVVIEPVMARLAAERRDPESVSRLEAFVADPQPDPDVDPVEQLRSGTEFHGMISGMSGN